MPVFMPVKFTRMFDCVAPAEDLGPDGAVITMLGYEWLGRRVLRKADSSNSSLDSSFSPFQCLEFIMQIPILRCLVSKK